MTAPTRNDGPGLSRRDELNVSGATMSYAPWRAAGATGAVVTGADLVLHLLSGHLAVSSSLSAGVVALFAVADRKSTRLNSSYVENSYAVFCLKKKKRIAHEDEARPPHRKTSEQGSRKEKA